ncbi:MAG: hypothetical protein WC584_02885 [Candidatus Pacearchaeota archaeon]
MGALIDDFYEDNGFQNDCIKFMKDVYYPKRKNRKLQKIAISADKICRGEFERLDVKCDYELRIFNCRTVGVVGDERAYYYPVEIEFRNLRHKKNNIEFTFGEEQDLWKNLSTRITNEVKGIGRVTVVVGSSKKYELFKFE